MDLPTMRARVRRDLHDEDSNNYRWTDDELDRHIQRALNEVSTAFNSCGEGRAHRQCGQP